VTLYRLFQSYSAQHDCQMVRVSVADPRGREYFAMIPRDEGRRWRERLTEALENIEAAIAQGCEPGEVKVMEPAA
jgi:hypothetical protein